MKQRYYLESVKYKEKIKDDFNVNPFKLDGIVKLKFNETLGTKKDKCRFLEHAKMSPAMRRNAPCVFDWLFFLEFP